MIISIITHLLMSTLVVGYSPKSFWKVNLRGGSSHPGSEEVPEHCQHHLAAIQKDAKLAQSLLHNGESDPGCVTGVLSLPMSEGGQVCVPRFCAEATDNEGCKSMDGIDSEEECCISRVAEQSCDRQTVPCVKACSESLPPCTIPKGQEFKKPVLGAGEELPEDCAHLPQWNQMVEAAIGNVEQDGHLAGVSEEQVSEHQRQVNMVESNLERVLSLPTWNLANLTIAVDLAANSGVHGRLVGAAYGLQSMLNSLKESISNAEASGDPRAISAAVPAAKLARLDERDGIRDGLASAEKLKVPHAHLNTVLGELEPNVQDVQAALAEAREAGLHVPQVGQAMDLVKLLELNAHKADILKSLSQAAEEAVKVRAKSEADVLAKKQGEIIAALKVDRLEKDLAIANAVLEEAEMGNLTVVEEGRANAASAVLFLQSVDEETARAFQTPQDEAKQRWAEKVAKAVAAARERGRAAALRAASGFGVSKSLGDDTKNATTEADQTRRLQKSTGSSLKAHGMRQGGSSNLSEMRALRKKILAFDRTLHKLDTRSISMLPDAIEPIVDTATKMITKDTVSSHKTQNEKTAFELKWDSMEESVPSSKQDRIDAKLNKFKDYLHMVSIAPTNVTLLGRALDTLTRIVRSAERSTSSSEDQQKVTNTSTSEGRKKAGKTPEHRNQTSPDNEILSNNQTASSKIAFPNGTAVAPSIFSKVFEFVAPSANNQTASSKIALTNGTTVAPSADKQTASSKIPFTNGTAVAPSTTMVARHTNGTSKIKRARSKARDFDKKWSQMEHRLSPAGSQNLVGDVVEASETASKNHTDILKKLSRVPAGLSKQPPSPTSTMSDSKVGGQRLKEIEAIFHVRLSTTSTTTTAHNIEVHARQQAGAKAIDIRKDASATISTRATTTSTAAPYNIAVHAAKDAGTGATASTPTSTIAPYNISVHAVKDAGARAVEILKDAGVSNTSTTTPHNISIHAIQDAGAKAVDILSKQLTLEHDPKNAHGLEVTTSSVSPSASPGKFDMLRVSPSFIRNLRFPHVKDLKETHMVRNISERIEQALAVAKESRDLQAKEVQKAQSKANQAKADAEKTQSDLQHAQTDLIEQQVASLDLRMSAQLGQYQDLIKESVHMGGELDALAKEHKTLSDDLTRIEKEMLAARRQHAIASGKLQAITHLSEQGYELKSQEYTEIPKKLATAHTRLDQQVKLLVDGQEDLETQKRERESMYVKLGDEIKNHALGVDKIQGLSQELSTAHVSLSNSLKEFEKSDASCEQIRVGQLENEHQLQTMLAARDKLFTFKTGAEEDQKQKPLLDTLEHDALDVEADCMDLDRRCSEKDETSCKLLKLNEQELELRLVAVQEKMIKMSKIQDDLALATTELGTLKPRIEAGQSHKEVLKSQFTEVCAGSAPASKRDLDLAKHKVKEVEQKLSQRLKEVKKTGTHLGSYGEQISKIDHKIELLLAGALSPAEQGIISIEEQLAFWQMKEAARSQSSERVKAMMVSEESNAQSDIQLHEREVEECQKQIQTKIDLVSSAEANIDLLVGKLESTTRVMIDVQETMEKLHMSLEPLETRIANLAEPVAVPQ